ncbi:MAG TPA: M13 family metallopeptidase [Steroidobacteraceae bacterium]|nr:M13 family metallopeptidase [Steroidobacteraceae bacterium]
MAAGTLLAASSALAAPLAPASFQGPLYPPLGLDMSAMDSSVNPGDDFFQHCNGAWIARTTIPPDRPSMTEGQVMRDRTEAQLRTIIEGAAAQAPHAPDSLEGKVGAFYNSFMNEKLLETLGVRPLAQELAAIRSSRTRDQLAMLMGHSTSGFEGTLFRVAIDVDLKNTKRYAVYLQQAGLTLPDRDYYLKPELAEQKRQLGDYVERLLTLSGWPAPHAHAAAILALETRIAQASWTKAEQRNLPNIYNPFTPAKLQAFAPGFSWPAFLQGAGLSARKRVIINEKSAFPKISRIFAATPLDTLQAWLAFTVADTAAPYLTQAFGDAHFGFHDRLLQGTTERSARWRQGIRAAAGGDCAVDPASCFGTLDWAVGQLYTARYFPPETKASIRALVAEVIRAFRARIERVDWMGEATRAEALRKLDTYVVKVGYPDTPRDYSGVVVRDDDLVGNVRRAAAADYAFYLARSDGPVDASEWIMTPQTVDAYNGSLRDIVFPAAILQAPDFDASADAAVNFGGIGTIIGHELTHGFDDQGRTLDASGNLRDWWTEADASAFKARAAVLGAQYASYEPVPGLHINPDLTMGENIADLGGLAIALDAYHASLNNEPAPNIDGLTGDQRFFLAFAQIWRGTAREDYIRKLTLSDPHSYRSFRVNGVVRNIDAWYQAFGVQPTDRLYIEPASRARIW